MTEWEYKWVRPFELSPRIMDRYGEDGWEYVGLLGGDWAIFKRPNYRAMTRAEIEKMRRLLGVGPMHIKAIEGKPCDALGPEDVREIVSEEMDRWGMG